VQVFFSRSHYFIQRHTGAHLAPHAINHRANLLALKQLGVKDVIGISSSGSLKKSIRPGSLVVPSDYIDLFSGLSFFRERVRHVTPCFDETLRKRIAAAVKRAGLKAFQKGVYFQTVGPRLETKAEVMLLKKHADIVGMTLGTEATLAKEIGLRYAGLCSVDNYANGLEKKQLTFEDVAETQKKSLEKIIKCIGEVIGETTR